MQIQTIRITAEATADNELGFVIINLSDFDSAKHKPFDDEARAALAGAVASGEIVPSTAELMAARDQMLERERALEVEKQRVADAASANEVEAKRLTALAAVTATAGAMPDIAVMTKEQLQAALTEKGVAFPAAANKADLQALLTA